MPPVPASRKFEIVTGALALAEERGAVALAEAAAITGTTTDQLRELLAPVLFLEFRDGQGQLIDHTHEFLLDENDVLQVEPGHSNWLRDLAATAPSSEALLRLYIAATVYQATAERPSPALDSALKKLRQSIAVEMVLPVYRPAAIDTAERARIAHRSLRFRYLSWKAEMATDREVLPFDVYSNWGNWFVLGPEVADPTGPTKHWRIDRMQDVVIGEVVFEPPTELPPRDWFDLSYRRLVVTVRVPLHRLPALPRPHTVLSSADDGAGMVRAEIEVAGDRQLDHLLVSLGPDGEVIEPAEYRQRREHEARRLLAHLDGG